MPKPNGYITLDFLVGTDIRNAAEEALELSRIVKTGVRFNFNGQEIIAWPHHTAEGIVNTYYNLLEIPRAKS